MLLPLLCFAEDKLALLPQPWVEEIHRITFEEYDATLKYWAEQHQVLRRPISSSLPAPTMAMKNAATAGRLPRQ